MKIVYTDPWFKLGTKALPLLVLILLTANAVNRALRNPAIDCITYEGRDGYSVFDLPAFPGGMTESNDSQEPQKTPTSPRKFEALFDVTPAKAAADKFCWDNSVFLVKKGYHVSMQERLFFPTVASYNPPEDKLIIINYYASYWTDLAIWSLLAYSWNLIWKHCCAHQKINSVLFAGNPNTSTKADIHAMALAFVLSSLKNNLRVNVEIPADATTRKKSWCLNLIGRNLSNKAFGLLYLFFKLLGVFFPLSLFVYIRSVLGPNFSGYGCNVLLQVIGESDTWPTPLDALFPSAALCAWNLEDLTQVSSTTTVCSLPLNNFIRPGFFVLWWVIVVTIFLLLTHFIHIVLNFFSPFFRHNKYRYLVYLACQEIVEAAAEYYEPGQDGGLVAKTHPWEQLVFVKLDFGAWILLEFIKCNCTRTEFDQFLRQVAAIPNSVIYIRSHQELVSSDHSSIDDEGYLDINLRPLNGN